MTAEAGIEAPHGDSTLVYYESHAAEYLARTFTADVSYLYDPFLSLLPKHGAILDVGCGSGRDLASFSARGFQPLGIDGSEAMAKAAHARTGLSTAVMRFDEIAFVDQFDGVWACASLLHVRKAELGEVLRRLHAALHERGVLFVSMQQGRGDTTKPDGRYFSLYGIEELEYAVAAESFEVLDVWGSSDALAGRSEIVWINLLARKL